MKTADFDYQLPAELIAQEPMEPRDASRLLVLHRSDGSLEHRHFGDLEHFLDPGDLLVANDSRVLPARLRGLKEGTGAKVELLLLSRKEVLANGEQVWETLAKPGRRLREGTWIDFASAYTSNLNPSAAPEFGIKAQVISSTTRDTRLVRLVADGDVDTALNSYGLTPLPPYIHSPLRDPERYQTVYATHKGSAAAPTAGLHFTPGQIERLRAKGVRLAFVTLHIGLDTFRPVQVPDLDDHRMHSEFATVTTAVAEEVVQTKGSGHRVVAVGTTAVRALESAARQTGKVKAFAGWTDLFIRPGYRFCAVDALITNFHLPRSTLVVLVSSFAGSAAIMDSYRVAVERRYRFYSFGDAMLIL